MRYTVCFIILSILLCTCCHGEYNIDTSALEESLGNEYAGYIGNQNVENLDFTGGAKSLLRSAYTVFLDKLRSSFKPLLGILICCSLICIVKSFTAISRSAIHIKVIDYTGVIFVLILSLNAENNILMKCSQAIQNVDSFAKILTPAYAVAAAVGKHPVTAASTAASSLLFTNLVTTLSINVFMPMITLYAVLSAVGSLSDVKILSGLCEMIKWLVGIIYRIILIVFTCYISVSGIISSSSDAIALKTTKTVISGAVPVVGGIIADAADTMLSGAALIKAGIGGFGLLGVCAICLVPFILCLVYNFIFKLMATFAGSLCGGAVKETLNGVSASYNLSLAVLGACCAIQFISIIVTAVVTIT